VFFVIVPVALVTRAVPAETAGGASGLFGTAQQLGGAIGVALPGTIFYGWVTHRAHFAEPTTHGAPYAIRCVRTVRRAVPTIAPHRRSRGRVTRVTATSRSSRGLTLTKAD
jgi:hypothetical protein